jgi:hypothetical protein
MKLDEITNKREKGNGINPNDEFYTPSYAIKPLLSYLEKYKTIWCPFDTEDSLFVKELEKAGHKVIHTHILEGKDFFAYEPENYDCIVSNPPYSLKTEVLERLFKIDKPFAMLLGVVGIFESQKRFNMFKHNDFEIMYFNKRISYFRDYNDEKPLLNPPFSSVYITHNMLPKQIVFEEVEK